MKRASIVALLLTCLACVGWVSGRYSSPYVDDWSDGVDLRGTGVDASAATLACLQATGRAILGEGTYTFDPNGTTAVTLPDGAVIEGAGMGLTICQMPDDETGSIFLLGSDCTLRGMTLDAFDDASTLGARSASAEHRATYERVEFRDFSVGFQDGAEAVNGLKLLGCRFTSCATGCAIATASTGVVIRDCAFNGNTTALSLQGDPIGGLITGCLFVSETTAVAMEGASKFMVSGNTVVAATNAFTISGATDCEFGQNSSAVNFMSLLSGTRNSYLGHYYGNAAPASGAWLTGEIVWDISPTSADPVFFVCTAGGSPGTWADGPDLP